MDTGLAVCIAMVKCTACFKFCSVFLFVCDMVSSIKVWNLQFRFPFYGHMLDAVGVTTGGKSKREYYFIAIRGER